MAKAKARRAYAAQRRAAVIARDRGACVYCLRKLRADAVTIDHLTPTSRGGGEEVENVALACAGCNGEKADMLPLEFVLFRLGYR